MIWKPNAEETHRFLKYMEVLLMRSLNNEGFRVSTDNFLSPNEASSSGTEFPSVEFLA